MSPIFLVILQLATPVQHTAGTRIEVNQVENRFRIVVQEPRRTKIYPRELESPGDGLPPGGVSVLVKNERGEVIGCGARNTPHRAADLSSNSAPVSEIKPLRLKKGQLYEAPWNSVAPLFVFFDECVKSDRRGGYVKYKILMRIDAGSDYLHAETDWLDFPGYETSGWNSVVKPPKKR